MITFDFRSYESCHINRPKTDIIDKYQFLKYNFQSLDFMNKRSCVGNVRFFYSNDNEKLELFHIPKKLPVKKTYVHFIECTEIICNIKFENGLFLIFFKDI